MNRRGGGQGGAGGRIVVLALGFVVSSLSSPSLLAVSFSPFL
jgi:hypothetical protein